MRDRACSPEEWTIWGFDGSYLRGVTTVYGSPRIFAHMAEAMITWQTKGGNPYACRAVLVEPREPYRSKPFMDDEDDSSHTVLLIWADGRFYDKRPIPIEYHTFNRNPGNDQSFGRRLAQLLDRLVAEGGRPNEQPHLDLRGGRRAENAQFDIGDQVTHPRWGVGRVIKLNVRFYATQRSGVS